MYSCDNCDLEFYDWNELKYHLESHLLSSAERKLCGHFEQIFIPELKQEARDIAGVDDNIEEIDITGEKSDGNCAEPKIKDFCQEKLDNNCTETQEVDLTSLRLPVDINFAEPNVNDNCTETQEIDLPSVKLPVDINFAEPNVNDNSEKKLYKKLEKSDTFKSKIDHGKSRKALCHVSAKATSDNHEDDSVSTVDKERPFKCSQCVKNFKNIISLRSHMKVHIFAKNYACPICKRSFPYDCKLKKHMVIHSEAKTYVCKICDKRFVLYKFLVNHMRRCSLRKYNSNKETSCHSFNHKAKLSIKGLCGENSVLKRKKEISQDSHSSSLRNIKSIKKNGLDVDANNVMKKEISVMSLGTNCLKLDDSSGGKLQFEINIGGITSPKCLRVESGELNVNKKLFGQRKGEVEKDTLKQKHPGIEVPKELLVKEMDTEKHEKLSNKTERQLLQSPREMCREIDKFEGKADTCSVANCEEKGVPYLHFINELFIDDELVTDDIYEKASDPLH